MRFPSALYPTSATRSRGFTLLLAALFASIAIALGSEIFSIVTKDITLSSVGRDSQFAFYTADSAAECALYWDDRFADFSNPVLAQPVVCGGLTATVVSNTLTISAGNTVATGSYTFQINVNPNPPINPNGSCTQVTITKMQDPVTSVIHTAIRSDGFNVGCANITTSATALERSVGYNY